MKRTKVIKDKRQTRTTIPKEYVDKHSIETGNEIEWDDKSGKLKGELKKEWKKKNNLYVN